jgi:hypothetical protein
MADKPQNGPLATVSLVSTAGQEGRLAPPMYAANRFAITGASVETLITFGGSRAVIDPATGHPEGIPAVEWLFTVSMSPIAIKQLAQSLTAYVAGFENMFGPIPVDPANEAAIKGMTAAQAKAASVLKHR